MEYVPLRFKEKKERLVFTGGGIGVSVAALSCICGNGKCGSVTDSDMDGGADPGSVSGKNVGYGENVLEDRLRIDRSTGPGDYRKTGWRSRVDAFVPDLRGWYLPETMAISGDRNSGSCHGIPNLYDVETLAVRRVLCGERIGIYQHHGAGIQYRRSVQYLFL